MATGPDCMRWVAAVSGGAAGGAASEPSLLRSGRVLDARRTLMSLGMAVMPAVML